LDLTTSPNPNYLNPEDGKSLLRWNHWIL